MSVQQLPNATTVDRFDSPPRHNREGANAHRPWPRKDLAESAHASAILPPSLFGCRKASTVRLGRRRSLFGSDRTSTRRSISYRTPKAHVP